MCDCVSVCVRARGCKEWWEAEGPRRGISPQNARTRLSLGANLLRGVHVADSELRPRHPDTISREEKDLKDARVIGEPAETRAAGDGSPSLCTMVLAEGCV